MRKFLLLILALSMFSCATALSEGDTLYNGDFSVIASGQPLPAGWHYEAWENDASRAYVETGENNENIVVINSYTDNDARVCQRISVDPKTCYRFTAEVYVYDVFYGAGATISVMDTFASSESEFETEEWKTITLVGVTGEEQNELYLGLRLGGYGSLSSGIAKFRNVRMEKLNSTPENALSFDIFSESEPTRKISDLSVSLGLTSITFASVIFAALGALVFSSVIITPRPLEDKKPKPVFVALVFTAIILRIMLSLIFVGHKTDIACFMSWSNRIAETGLSGFYSESYFADYPPGYMYVLWIIGTIKNLLGLNYGSAAFVLLLKIPAIIAEFATAFIVYKLAVKQELSNRSSWAILLIMLFHPAFAFISGGWGQIDSILTLCIIGVLYLFTSKKKRALAGLLYGVAILLKPQALMLGPLLAIAYLLPQKNRRYRHTLLEAELAVLGAFAVIIICSLPFSTGNGFGWLFDKYFSTITSYSYASIEAFNLAAFYGGNWKPIDSVPFLFSYGAWGTFGVIASLAATFVLYIKGRKVLGKTILFVSSAFLFVSLFTFGPYMHERYLYPALPLMLISAIYIDDKRLYLSFIWLSVTLLLNSLCAFYITDHQSARTMVYDSIVTTGSLMTLLGFAYFAYTSFSLVLDGKIKKTALKEALPTQQRPSAAGVSVLLNEDVHQSRDLWGGKQKFTRKDKLFCIVVTAVYALFALTNLGEMSAPITEYFSAAGDEVLIEFDSEQDVAEIWVFPGIAEGTLLISGNGKEISYEETLDDMFRWKIIKTELVTDNLSLSTYSGKLGLRELAFFDSNRERVWPSAVTEEGLLLFDEPSTVPEEPSYLNGMYFDELYHARTAYEHLNRIDPYENSHPPLGKIFIMAGIAIFGMNAFGWRIVGALFGIAMLPVLYAFAKRLFKNSEYALLAVTLFAFDFMHFTQTRIATIDVFAVFFIILMYYFMFEYYTMSFYEDGLAATLRPLGLAGLFFGLGAASKWICVYAGLGLAVLLVLSLARRYKEYRAAINSSAQALIQKYGSFTKLCIKTLLWCCVFYIAVPMTIYIASYIPHFMLESGYGLDELWGNQVFMFEYHSKLTATHSFSSMWFEWPLTFKPMWYYINSYSQEGMISTLSASGNPAVWWICSLGTLGLIIQQTYKKVFRPNTPKEPYITVLLVGLCANYLPWTLITRCTFIYHFFATVPFIILCSVMLLQKLENWRPNMKWIKWIKWGWMALCIILFLLMYPGISGLEVPVSYAQLLYKLPGGKLFYGL